MISYKTLRILFSVFFLFSAGSEVCAQNATKKTPPASLDMEAAVRKGLELNEQIRSAEHGVLGTKEGRRSAMGAFGPTVTATYAYHRLDDEPTSAGIQTGDKEYYDANLNIHQPLFTGFNLLSSYQKAELSEEIAKEQLRLARLEVILAVQTNYLELLKARENVRSAEDSLARLESQLKVSRAFYDVGLRPKLDVLQAEVDVAKAEQTLLTAKNNVQVQIAKLNSLLDMPILADILYTGELEYIPFTWSFEQCLKLSRKKRPDLVIAEKTVQVANKDSKITASTFYPQVSADFDYYRYGDDPALNGSEYRDRGQWELSAGIRWELFSSGTTFFAYRQSREKVSQMEAEWALALNEAAFEVRSNYLRLEEAADRIRVARKAVIEAKEGYRMALARYKAQVGTNTDVLDAQARLTNAEADLTQAQADYQQTLARLYFSIGEEHPSLTM